MERVTYRRKMWALGGLAFLTTIGVGVAVGVLGRDYGELLPVWFLFPIMLLLAAALFWVCWLWWKPLDDVQKQGHMASWYWGGMGGAVLMIMWLVANRAQHSDFGTGAATMFFAQFAGFVLFYLLWRLRGRGAQE